VKNLDEFQLIRHLTERVHAAEPHVQVGIGDDAAVLSVGVGEEVLATTDAMVDGVHFRTDTLSFYDVGYKAVAASLSDIAAMGGEPRHVLIALAVPTGQSVDSLEQIYDGVADICLHYGCALIGGDVVSTAGPLMITTTVLGSVPAGTALLRSGATPGDIVFVTGTVGDSGAGLKLLLEKTPLPADEAYLLVSAHQRPSPQVRVGQLLRQEGASSCDDITDGLANELNEIANASGVRLRIDRGRIPLSPPVKNLARRRQEAALDYAWYGGEDYQLVGTASPFVFARALSRCESMGIKITQIGKVEAGEGVIAVGDGDLAVLEPKGYNHMRKE
jgi:thiamine-monophosphate kinase